jgi:anti-sigma factor RsiW
MSTVVTDTTELSCQEFVELVTAYLDGGLTAAESSRFDGHLGACGHCAHYLEQIRQTIRVTGTLRAEDLSPEAETALLAAFRGWRGAN